MDDSVYHFADRMAGWIHGISCGQWTDSSVAGFRDHRSYLALRIGQKDCLRQWPGAAGGRWTRPALRLSKALISRPHPILAYRNHLRESRPYS